MGEALLQQQAADERGELEIQSGSDGERVRGWGRELREWKRAVSEDSASLTQLKMSHPCERC